MAEMSSADHMLESLPASGLTNQLDPTEWEPGKTTYQFVTNEHGTALYRMITINPDADDGPWVVVGRYDDSLDDWVAVGGLQRVEGSSATENDALIISQLVAGNKARLYPGEDEPQVSQIAPAIGKGTLRLFWQEPEDLPTATFLDKPDEPFDAA